MCRSMVYHTCVEVWYTILLHMVWPFGPSSAPNFTPKTSNLRPLRLGEEKKKEERKKPQGKKWSALFIWRTCWSISKTNLSRFKNKVWALSRQWQEVCQWHSLQLTSAWSKIRAWSMPVNPVLQGQVSKFISTRGHSAERIPPPRCCYRRPFNELTEHLAESLLDGTTMSAVTDTFVISYLFRLYSYRIT